MAERETEIVLKARNEASKVAKEVSRDYQVMGRDIITAINASATAMKSMEGSLRAIATISKSTHGMFREVGLTARQGMTMVSENSKRAQKSVDEFGGASQRASKSHSTAMAAAGASTRGLLEILKHVGPEATRGIATAAAGASDFATNAKAARSAGDGAFDGFASGAKMAGDAIKSVSEKLDELRVKAGKGLVLSAAAEGVALGKSAMTAGGQLATERGISRILGSPEKGATVMKDLREFDRESPFDFSQSANIARKALASGVKPEDLKQYMTDIGDAVTTFGEGTVEEFGRVNKAFSDMRGGTRISAEELNQLRDANIPAKRILQQQLGLTDKQAQGLQEGTFDVDPEVGIAALRRGFRAPGIGGSMKDAQENTLGGATSALGSSAVQASVGITQHLVPALISIAGAVRSVTDAFAAMPEWMQKTIAYLIAFNIGFKLFSGILLLAAPLITGIGTAFKIVGGIAALTGVSIGGLGAALAGLSPILATVVTAVSGVAIGITTAVGALVGILAGGALYKIGQALGLIDKEQSFGDRMATGWGRVRDLATGNQGHYDKTVQEQWAKDRAAKAPENDLEKLIASFKAGSSGAATAGAAGIPGMAGAATGAVGNIESLEDQLRALAPGKETAARRKELQNQIFYARRAERHEREAEAQKRKDETAREKAEREALKASGLNASVDSSAATGGLDERGASLQGAASIAESREKRALARQTREIRRQVKSGAMTDEAGNAKIESLKAALDARNKAREADLEMQIAGINAQKEIIESQARAAGQTGVQRESTLAIGQNRAARIMGMAREKAALLREEVLDLQEAAAERLQEAAESMRGIADQLRKKGVGASWGGPGGDGGSMLRMATGNYGGGDSFVGNNAALMAAGIARAQGNSYAGRATYSADAIENRFSGREQVPVEFREAGRNNKGQTIYEVIGQIVVDTSGNRLSRSSAVML